MLNGTLCDVSMSAIAFSPPALRTFPAMSQSINYSLPPAGQASSGDRRMSSANESATGATTVLMRKLPKAISPEAVRAMLLFAKDLIDAEIVHSDSGDEHAFSTAIARFSTLSGALEAQSMLDGKPNGVDQTNMIVEVVNGPGMTSLGRRNTIDPPTSSRVSLHPVSPPLANPATHPSARFNGAFQPLEKSPSVIGSPPIPEHPTSDPSGHLQNFFSPQSPRGNSLPERSRVTGKSVIDQDAADDDTGELLKDPVAYMKNDSAMPGSGPRRLTNPQLPLSRFANLSLNTNPMTSPPVPQYTSPRSAVHNHTPLSALSPPGAASHYHAGQQQFLRHNYPPVNPADQNPPCNTLYVGNLPIDTSEDELKALFSKQRGYKRLCFRTKQNGPMCFVEFEDVSFATKALNELYGVQLHNSVKGGIRLSFSKNPLGVRSGQPGSANPTSPLTSPGAMSVNGFGSMSPGGFTTASGPPPGLALPPGLGMHVGMGPAGVSGPMSPSMINPSFSGQGLAIGPPGMHGMRGTMGAPTSGPPMGPPYPSYMNGR